MIMWSAVILRILENGSTRSPGQGSTVGWTTGPVDGTGDGGRGTGAVAGALAPVSMKPRMSCLVTRPANPVPGMVEMSSWCSAAILRTSGVDLRRNRSSAVSVPSPPFPTGAGEGGRGPAGAVVCGGETAVPPGAAGARSAAATGGAAGAGASARDPAPAAPLSRSSAVSTVWTATVPPHATLQPLKT